MPTPRRAIPVLAALLASCGGPNKPTPPLIACQPPGDSVIFASVQDYLRTVQPKPRRFLIAVGTDSALPDAGRAALQQRGPTFLYPPDTAKQAALRSQLAKYENVPTLLVTWGGVKATEANATVRVAGRFVGGEMDGRATAARSYRFECDTAHWRFKGSRVEQTT